MSAVYEILAHKRSNVQFGVSMYFPYTNAKVRSKDLVSLYEESWIAFKPLLDFVLDAE